jgi:hypothetical protein
MDITIHIKKNVLLYFQHLIIVIDVVIVHRYSRSLMIYLTIIRNMNHHLNRSKTNQLKEFLVIFYDFRYNLLVFIFIYRNYMIED